MLELGTTVRSNANAGARMVLRHHVTGADLEDGEGKKVVLFVLGRDADAVKRCEREFHRRNQEQAKRSRNHSIDAEVWEQHALNIAVVATTGWENAGYKGRTEFSADLIREFYRNEPWALEQVQAFMDDRANFSEPLKTP